MSPIHVLTLDIGTSSARAAVYDHRARPVPEAAAASPYSVATTADGGAELDPDALIEAVVSCCERALGACRRREVPIAAVGACTFWHSFLGVDSGCRAVTPVYMWSDTRSAAQVKWLRQRLDEPAVHARTGCRFHTSYLPARLLWVAQNQPERYRAAARWISPGEYLFNRLLIRTRDGPREGLGSSVSMASGTGLYNQGTGDWDEELLAALPIARAQLPAIVDDQAIAQGLQPRYLNQLPELRDAAWLPARGDGACSNVGSGCVDERRAALMVGTSGAMRVLGGGGAAPFGLWRYRLDRLRPITGGAISNGGSVVAWLADVLRLRPEDIDAIVADLPPDGHGLTVLPFWMGERSPNWRGDARAAIVGLAQHTSAAEVCRAALEAVAYRLAAVHDLLAGSLRPDYQLVATGQALLSSAAWTQMVADVLNRPVTLSRVDEASSRGAAILALQRAGAIGSLDECDPAMGTTVDPRPDAVERYREGRDRHERLYQQLIAKCW
jgi:gluconokinase